MVIFDNLSKIAGGPDLTEKNYLEETQKQLAGMESRKYSFSEQYITSINGIDYKVLRTDETTRNMTQYYFTHKQGKFMVGIIVTLLGDTKIDDILVQFK